MEMEIDPSKGVNFLHGMLLALSKYYATSFIFWLEKKKLG